MDGDGWAPERRHRLSRPEMTRTSLAPGQLYDTLETLMSKKDFITTTSVLKRAREVLAISGLAHRQLVEMFAVAYKETNPRFNEDLFIRESGCNGGDDGSTAL